MDPRPSRRADQSSICRMMGTAWSQWILGRVVALTQHYSRDDSATGWSQWILGRVVALTSAAALRRRASNQVSMDPRPSRRADSPYIDRGHIMHKSQWILGRVVALTGCTHLHRKEATVSMDPRPSRRADYAPCWCMDLRRVSMDPRPSRRADLSIDLRDWSMVRRLNGSSAESSR